MITEIIPIIEIISLKNSPVTDSEIKELAIEIDGIEYSGLLVKKEKIENGK